MQSGPTVRAIRQSLQLIQTNAEHLAAEKITREVKKIDALLTRLEAQIESVLDEKNSD